ncbi:MAG: DUF454 family protein [Enterococcus avium]
MTKVLFNLLGGVYFLIGTLGIFLPLLPTTVFYLGSSFFYIEDPSHSIQNLSTQFTIKSTYYLF